MKIPNPMVLGVTVLASGVAFAKNGTIATQPANANQYYGLVQSPSGGCLPPANVPDVMVQYGCVVHPELTSGSFGAMLRGENPAPESN